MEDLNLRRLPHHDLRPPRLTETPIMTESIISGVQVPAAQPQYWHQQDQKWLAMSINMNPLRFANYEMFKSGNMNFQESPNPVQCVLCFAFKVVIMLLYFITPYYPGVALYELIVIVGAIDFWVIKNICGRTLVGLRWWAEIDEAGNERWVFETHVSPPGPVQRIHSRIFWFIQVFMFFMFAGMFIVNLASFNLSVSLCMIWPAIFTGFNLWAFNQCNKVKSSQLGEHIMQSSVGRRSVKLPLKIE